MFNDTIAAISTPVGEGGIGIVRVSGDDAISIANNIFKAARKDKLSFENSHRLVYGYVFDPGDGNNVYIDEIMLGIMRAPNTYTREDIVEFNCHGGLIPLKKTLELVLRYGARLAEPGEFTKRAFLNGRLDLAQAESIIDIIRSKTDTGLNVALNQLEGKLSGEIKEIQNELLDVLANIEVSIDFSEDELGEKSVKELKEKVYSLLDRLQNFLDRADVGKIYREGIKTVIVGKPNVGKSSLLNALLRDKRAIVTEVPGTTRDVIEEIINIKGIPVRLMDTAGLRHTDDVVEKIGVEKSRELIENADFVLVVIDVNEGLTGEDKKILDFVKNKKGIIVLNKIDLRDPDYLSKEVKETLLKWPVVEVSVTNEEGLFNLEDKIEDTVIGEGVTVSDSLLISNVRHKEALSKAVKHLNEVLEGLDTLVPVDLLAIDVKESWESLGEITGETVTEDLIDKIFSDFCVGK